MRINKVYAVNFLSFKEVEYTFKRGISVLLGDNQTDPGQRSNGSGKSAFSAAIEYALLHTTSKKTLDKDLIFWGEQENYVSVELFCPLRNETLLIERTISIKSGGSSQLSLNDKVLFAFDDKMVDTIDKYIQQWVGISPSDIQNYFIINKFKYKSFFESSNTMLLQLISRFSNISIIDGINKDLYLKESKNNSLIQDLRLKYSRNNGSIDSFKTMLEREQNIDFDELVQGAMDNIDAEIIKVEGEKIGYLDGIALAKEGIASCKEDLNKLNEDLKSSEARLKSFKADNYDELITNIDQQIKQEENAKTSQELKIQSKNKDLVEMRSMVAKIDVLLSGSITCPKCSHVFVPGKDVDVKGEIEDKEEIESAIEGLEKIIDSYRSTINEYVEKIGRYRNEKKGLVSKAEEQFALKKSMERRVSEISNFINNKKSEIEIFNNKIERYKESILNCESRIKQLINSKKDITPAQFDNKEKIEKIKQDIEDFETVNNDILTQISDLEAKNAEFVYWAVIFEKFIQWLSVKVLKTLEGYSNYYLDQMKSDLRIQLDGYKLKADGKISDKITPYVIRDGEKHSFYNFSGGEMVKLEAAVILAVKRAINSTHKFGGLDFLSIDEIFESADDLGLTVLINSLENIDHTILLTTHVPLTNIDCNVIKFVKQNGVTLLV